MSAGKKSFIHVLYQIHTALFWRGAWIHGTAWSRASLVGCSKYPCSQPWGDDLVLGYIVITGAVLAAIQKLHRGGYVHGDIRDTNILVNSESRIYIIDFDWAGRMGVTKYPLQAAMKLKQPKDVIGGGTILDEQWLISVSH